MDMIFTAKPIDNYILDFFCYELMLGLKSMVILMNFLVLWKDGVKENRMNELGLLFEI
jgi:hypothetical protein